MSDWGPTPADVSDETKCAICSGAGTNRIGHDDVPCSECSGTGETWETGEVSRYVENTPNIYHETEGLNSAMAMKLVVMRAGVPGFLPGHRDWAKVDWHEVWETRTAT